MGDETVGMDSLYPGVGNAFAFWRAYAEAEVERGNPPPFSPRSVILLNALETRYLHRVSSSERPSAGYSNSAMRARALSNAR
jgi:hypothetical protein